VGSAVLLLAATLVAAAVATADENSSPSTPSNEAASDAQAVDMFAAIDKGDISVKLIPKDSRQSRVIIENKTDQPLTVKLPDAFAGVPTVLAQAGATGSKHSSSSSSKNKNQSTGGGMGGMGGGGGGGGMFSIPPEKVEKFDVATVCLEHGKGEPRASVTYEIKPLESVTTKTGVRELCQMLGSGKINQRVAQAAAWHLANDMTWDELAAKKIHHLGGVADEQYFTAAEIQAAMQLSATVVAEAKEAKKQKSEDQKSETSGDSSSSTTTDK
jgi:hypothetical protein